MMRRYATLDKLDLYELHSGHWRRYFWYCRRDPTVAAVHRKRAMAVDVELKSRELDPTAKTHERGYDYQQRQAALGRAKAEGATLAELQALERTL